MRREKRVLNGLWVKLGLEGLQGFGSRWYRRIKLRKLKYLPNGTKSQKSKIMKNPLYSLEIANYPLLYPNEPGSKLNFAHMILIINRSCLAFQ